MKYFLLFLFTILFGLILLLSCSEDDPVSVPKEHAEASGIVLLQNDSVFFKVFEGVIKSAQKDLIVSLNQTTDYYQIKFLDEHENVFDLYDDIDKSFAWIISDTSIVNIEMKSADKWSFRLTGKKQGKTDIEFQVLHSGHTDFKTPKIEINVE